MISLYIVYFTVLSFIGYLYECTAVTLWGGKWENRGFLFGPIIPIYGAGALLTVLVFGPIIKNYTPILVFVLGTFGSALLEYPTSYILEKLFHAYWWDYSNAPLNINGRVSLFTSLGFGIGALIIVYLINPVVVPFLLSLDKTLLEILSYLSVMGISMDLALTVSVLSDFEDKVAKLQAIIDEHIDEAVDSINPKGRNIKRAIINTKENIIDAGVDKTIDSMNAMYHSAISRIRGFRNSGSETIHIIKNAIKLKNDRMKDSNER